MNKLFRYSYANKIMHKTIHFINNAGQWIWRRVNQMNFHSFKMLRFELNKFAIWTYTSCSTMYILYTMLIKQKHVVGHLVCQSTKIGIIICNALLLVQNGKWRTIFYFENCFIQIPAGVVSWDLFTNFWQICSHLTQKHYR